MAGEWRAAFKFVGAVQVVEEDILSGRADAVVGQATMFTPTTRPFST
jgi:hypothetical protein